MPTHQHTTVSASAAHRCASGIPADLSTSTDTALLEEFTCMYILSYVASYTNTTHYSLSLRVHTTRIPTRAGRLISIYP